MKVRMSKEEIYAKAALETRSLPRPPPDLLPCNPFIRM